MRSFKRLCEYGAVFLILFVTACGAKPSAAVIAPSIFIRGQQSESGTLYSVSVIKPSDDAVMTNLHGEIILPAGARLVELLIPESIDQAYGALNAEGAVGLVWEQAHVASDDPLEPFSFVLDAPLDTELEFYLRWTDANGETVVESFFEKPPVVDASVAQEEVALSGEGYVPAGETGVQILADGRDTPLDLRVEVLPASYNPPESLAALWWCSIVAIDGLPPGDAVQVVVPLRRPIAPFTSLQIVQQAADGSWTPLDTTAIVTADGQYVTYSHPGGRIATGGDPEIRPEEIEVDEDAVEMAQVSVTGKESTGEFAVFSLVINNITANVAEVTPTPSGNSQDGTSNTVILPTATITPTRPPGTQDGSSNTVIIPTATITPTRPPGTQDGTSNTVIIPTATRTPTRPPGTQDGTSNTVIIPTATITPTRPPGTQDGTSNTVIIPTATRTPTRPPGTQDGTSNTVIIPTATRTPTRPPGTQDGTSNTVILPTATRTPTRPPGTQDGTSNTVIIPTATITPTRPPGTQDGTSNTVIIPTATRTPTRPPGTQDGTSNTVIIPTATRTPTRPPGTQDGTSNTVIIPTATRTPTRPPGTQDGTSNTIFIGEITATPGAGGKPAPTATRRPTIIPPSVQIQASTGTPQPTASSFGSGGVRIQVSIAASGQITQCQSGGVNCAIITRRLGFRT